MERASTQYKREHKNDFGLEKIDILYEDAYIVIISKPSGMLTVPYPGSKARTAIGVLGRMMRKRGTYAPRHRPLIVHRLDRDTSGIMMFALTSRVQKALMANWQNAIVERLYRAVGENPKWTQIEDAGLIDAPLAYNAYNIGFVPKAGAKPSESAYRLRSFGERHNKSMYEKHLDFSTGEPRFKTVEARTHFRVIERGPTHTLFELALDTGKKNQIRAHLSSRGYTVAGDENYRAKTDPFGRLALHARTLEFVHPTTRERLRFDVPEPDEWLLYVKRGDVNPMEPIWQTERRALLAAKREAARFGDGKGSGFHGGFAGGKFYNNNFDEPRNNFNNTDFGNEFDEGADGIH